MRSPANLVHIGACPDDVRRPAGCRDPRNAATSSQCMSDLHNMEMLERALCALAELYSSTMSRTVILFKAKTNALLAHATSHRDLSFFRRRLRSSAIFRVLR